MRGGLRNGGGAKGNEAAASEEWATAAGKERLSMLIWCSNPEGPPHFTKQIAASVQARVDFDMSQHGCFVGHASSPICIVCAASETEAAWTGVHNKAREISTPSSMRKTCNRPENIMALE